MTLPVYDFRTDVRNIFVTSQIRSRFLKFEVGTVAQRHSHDLGHEIFLILSGRAEFEIDGEKAELGPGATVHCAHGPTSPSAGAR